MTCVFDFKNILKKENGERKKEVKKGMQKENKKIRKK
jgi:hypothetical protein